VIRLTQQPYILPAAVFPAADRIHKRKQHLTTRLAFSIRAGMMLLA